MLIKINSARAGQRKRLVNKIIRSWTLVSFAPKRFALAKVHHRSKPSFIIFLYVAVAVSLYAIFSRIFDSVKFVLSTFSVCAPR